MKNLFKDEWAYLESSRPRPERWRSYIKVRFSELQKQVLEQDPGFVKKMAQSLYAGNVYILQGAYTREFIEELKHKAFQWGNERPTSFHKMLDGVPDFHRIVDEDIKKNYSIETIRHVYYFFPWNSDPLKLMKSIYERWRIIKLIGGYAADQYEKNSPKDGIVDRVIIAQYPAGTGELETHGDPYLYQRTIMGAKMSQRGVDYQQGGLYFVDQEGREVDIEDEIDVGDMYISYATVLHGVKMVDPGKKTDWTSMKGRWFLGLYSAVSDVPEYRHTSYAIKKEDYEGKRLYNHEY